MRCVFDTFAEWSEGISHWLLVESYEMDGFQDKMVQIIGRFIRQAKTAFRDFGSW